MADFDIGSEFLKDALHTLRTYKKMADESIAQVSDVELFRQIDPESNSIAIIVKHMAGNMRSRWTDFLTSDGDKPDRHRDTEFEVSPGTTRAQLMESWEEGWKLTSDAITPLTAADLGRTVTIRGKKLSVLQAINRQLMHYAGHVNQIILLAKHFRGAEWKTLSIPKGKSEEFSRRFEDKRAALK
jgi:hypothetical protein